ncbi:MAG: phage tail sheath family protein, partial [Chloroflexi bacterium]
TIAAGALSPVHKETAVFQIKLPNTDAASGVVGNHGTTTGAGDFDLAANPVPVTTAGQPVHPGTVSVVFSPSGNIVDNGDGTVTGSGFPGPTTSLTGFIDYDTGKMYTDAAFTTPLVVTGAANGTAASSAVTTTFDVSTFIEKAATTDNLAQGVALAAAALNGASLDAGGTNPNTIDLVDSVTAPTGSGAISFSTTAPSAPSTYGPGVILVDYVAAGVVDSDVAGNLSGDVGVGTNTVDFTTGDVDVELASPALGVTLSHGAVTSGPFSVGETVTGGTSGATGTVAVLGSGFMVVESVANGPFQSGEVVTGGTSGASATLDSASLLTGSSIDADYQTGQVVTDDGLGNLIGDVDAAGNNTIDYATGAYDVTFAAAPLNGSNVLANYVSLPRVVEFQLTGGSDGTAVTRAEISDPSLEANKEGIYAFDDVEDPLNMVVPDFEGSQFVQADLVDFAKARNTRFAILGAANGTTKDEVIKYVLVDQAFDNKVSAFYWPNVYFVNELTNRPELIPVTPFVAGVYARTAFNKNVGKSPGGIEDGRIDANGVVGPEFGNLINDINVRDALYQSRINPLFNSDATGFVVWGVRSLSTETRWRYVNARLLHNFLMDAVNRQLQWAVFENNGPALWARIETALKGFFGSLFRQGYFAGTTEEQAFFVVCNRSNNNQSTIDEGKVIVDIGFSPFKPAEFIVFRLSQPASTITI